MTIPTADNAQRVESAHTALMAFGQYLGPEGPKENRTTVYQYDGTDLDLTDPDQYLTIAGDLVANLMHAADVAGVDWQRILTRADMHYSAETTEPYDLP
jgi:hypothetical protein